MIPAGRASLIFILNLSFISQFWVLVAAIVVSEIMDRLSPNIAPPTKAPRTIDKFIPLDSVNPTAIGPKAVIVPTDDPVANDIKLAIKNIPAVKNLNGIKAKPKPTTESTPPEADARVEKAPANK